MGQSMRCSHLSTPLEIAPMSNRFIHPKIDGFSKDKKQINRVCVCVSARMYECVDFNSF